MRRHLIITGIPASGKSTVGKALAEALGLKMFDKDDILEELFEERGIGDASWRRMLSRTADQILQERVALSESSIVVSWWRHPRSSTASGTPTEWLAALEGTLIEVHCICDPSMAARRFSSRQRHPGHLDGNKSESSLIEEFKRHAALGPLGIAPLVEVDTSRPLNLPQLLSLCT